ncbi:hypothetical protein Ahy_B10g102838 [Arachis hypogaea]|uniref:Uncharacterized protein n=1 Tax=Arachis hypogaea TaxID=3818 RepID=A0A444X2Y3_ARAHY|nr:hypothetical protein Ahy_B10g102838 [Arachis hypogaea]
MVVTTLSSNYDELHTLMVATAARKVEMEKLCIDEMLRKYCEEHFIFTSLASALEACRTMTARRSGDAPPAPTEQLGAPVGSSRRSRSRLVDTAAPLCRSGNLFVETNLKLDSSSPFSLSDIWLRGRRRWRSSSSIICSESTAEIETLHLHKPRVDAGGLPHDDLDLRRLRAGVAMHRRRLRSGWEHLRDMAKGVGVSPPYRSENLFVATNLKLDSSSPYSLSDLRTLLATTAERKAEIEKLCIDEML